MRRQHSGQFDEDALKFAESALRDGMLIGFLVRLAAIGGEADMKDPRLWAGRSAWFTIDAAHSLRENRLIEQFERSDRTDLVGLTLEGALAARQLGRMNRERRGAEAGDAIVGTPLEAMMLASAPPGGELSLGGHGGSGFAMLALLAKDLVDIRVIDGEMYFGVAPETRLRFRSGGGPEVSIEPGSPEGRVLAEVASTQGYRPMSREQMPPAVRAKAFRRLMAAGVVVRTGTATPGRQYELGERTSCRVQPIERSLAAKFGVEGVEQG